MTHMDLNTVDAPAGFPEGLNESLESAMRKRGFSELTSVQKAVFDVGPKDHDLRISSQTGSGKTVAIGLGLARHLVGQSGKKESPSVLVLVPTRELAMQVREELQWLYSEVRGLRVEVVMGGASLGIERRALSRCPHVIVGTPGRVHDHIRSGAFRCERIAHVVLDEADRMLDMGFREELEAILEALPSERRTHMVSATFAHQVSKLANRFQRDPLTLEGTRLGDANDDIQHLAHLVRKGERYGALVNLLLLNEDARCLVFVERRVDASSVSEQLASDGFAAACLSGELPQAQRTRTINAFRSGSTRVLVSTDVAARGIDVPDIEFVVHYDMPENADAYTHRSGRTGRAGRQGRSHLLVVPMLQRMVTRMLSSARVEVMWQPVPTAAKVRKAQRKRFRRGLHAHLATEADLTESQLDYAKALLEDRDPAAVIARLLELAQPSSAREPVEVHEPSPSEANERQWTDRGRGAGRGDGRSLGRGGSTVRFSINWGERSGAATNRLLSHVCRRGQIQGKLIGAIEIGDQASTFEVDATMATEFEKLARVPDPREPRLRIERLGASSPRSTPRSRTGHARPKTRSARKPDRPSRNAA